MSLQIVRLSVFDVPALEAHLQRLSPQDRSFRFAAGVVEDETLRRHVAAIRFDRDVVLGVHDEAGRIVACAQGCVYEVGGRVRMEAAFSVDVEHRRQHLCLRMMKALEQFAVEMGAEALVAMCVARNLPMRRIFEQSSMRTSREDNEVHAVLQIAT